MILHALTKHFPIFFHEMNFFNDMFYRRMHYHLH